MSVYQKLACEAAEQKAGRSTEEGAAYCANKHNQAGVSANSVQQRQQERLAAESISVQYPGSRHHRDAASGPGVPNHAGWVGAVPSYVRSPNRCRPAPVPVPGATDAPLIRGPEGIKKRRNSRCETARHLFESLQAIPAGPPSWMSATLASSSLGSVDASGIQS